MTGSFSGLINRCLPLYSIFPFSDRDLFHCYHSFHQKKHLTANQNISCVLIDFSVFLLSHSLLLFINLFVCLCIQYLLRQRQQKLSSPNIGNTAFSPTAPEESTSSDDPLFTEPVAPTLSLGERVAWIRSSGPEFGNVKWIGRMPQVTNDWTVGVEFVRIVCWICLKLY